MRNYRMYSICKIVNGIVRACILDLQRKDYVLIPLACSTYLKENTIIEYDSVPKEIKEWIDKLISMDFLFEVDEENKDCFPDLKYFPESPNLISNSIVDINSDSHTQNLINKEVASQLDKLGCEAVEIRLFNKITLTSLIKFLSSFKHSGIRHISLFINNEYYTNDELNEVFSHENRVRYIIISGCNTESQVQVRGTEAYIFYIKDQVVNKHHCGQINQKHFTVDKMFYFESKLFNNCLYKKIAIDEFGEIKNCPSMRKSYGNIKESSLIEALNAPEFKEVWTVNKDLVTKCKHCEFRYICTDCRVYREDDSITSAPLKCGYDPYTGKWEPWYNNGDKKNRFSFIKSTIAVLFIMISSTFFTSCMTKIPLKNADIDFNYKNNQELEVFIDTTRGKWKYQVAAWEYSMIGEYLKSQESWIKSTNVSPGKSDTITIKAEIPISISHHISELAQEFDLVAINEAHHIPEHRITLYNMLDELYAEGFQNLFIEAYAGPIIDNIDSLPSIDSIGNYIKEPWFGNMIKRALRIGFTIFPYEANDNVYGSQREVDQAENIYNILNNKKSVIYCGFGHNKSNCATRYPMMATILKTNFQLNVLTIDQTLSISNTNIIFKDNQGETIKYPFVLPEEELRDSFERQYIDKCRDITIQNSLYAKAEDCFNISFDISKSIKKTGGYPDIIALYDDNSSIPIAISPIKDKRRLSFEIPNYNKVLRIVLIYDKMSLESDYIRIKDKSLYHVVY